MQVFVLKIILHIIIDYVDATAGAAVASNSPYIGYDYGVTKQGGGRKSVSRKVKEIG
jgi:hypothetical protein